MGGGASSAAAEQMEEMMAYSVLLSKTITCMSFPGMYSIKDFNLFPKKDSSASLHKAREGRDCSTSTTGSFSRSSSGSEGPPPLLSPELEDNFTVVVDGELIVLDDVTKQNEEGWTPLHACCHSSTTANIGIKILKEVVAMGGDLNLKTKRGPGNFNSGFTPLHMACAYGVADLVDALIEAGADPNCRNDFDWGPLLEVCHRGFMAIAATLVRAGADVAHIPDAEASCGAHIMRGAPQSALGEAARGGYKTICKFLLENGGDKDQKNSLGWTPLHEACYFNHLDTVQLLLVHGADPLMKNAQGALPYNMTSFQPIRDLLREIGGEDAAKTMPTPTFSVCVNEKGQMFVRVTAGEPDEDEEEEAKPAGADEAGGSGAKSSTTSAASTKTTKKSSPSRSRSPQSRGGGGGLEAGGVLHKGPMLGELPALGKPSAQGAGGGGSTPTTYDSKRDGEERRKHGGGGGGEGGRGSSDGGSGGAEGRRGREETRDTNALRMPGETDEGKAPEGIICQLSKRVARDPVRTPYGHLFDRQMIGLWLSKQGSICPLTGQPLVEAELKADDKARAEAKAWSKDTMARKTQASAGGGGAGATGAGGRRSKHAEGRGGGGTAAGAAGGAGGEGGEAGKQLAGGSTPSPSSGRGAEPPAAKDSPSSAPSSGRATTGRGGGHDEDAPAKSASKERRDSKGADNDDDIYEF